MMRRTAPCMRMRLVCLWGAVLLLCAVGGTHADGSNECEVGGHKKPRQPACEVCIGPTKCAKDCNCPSLGKCGNGSTVVACRDCFTSECPHCTLLGSVFGYIVQGALGFVAGSSLLVKRHFEKPPRPFVVWGAHMCRPCVCGRVHRHP